jgi:hypothetical protein
MKTLKGTMNPSMKGNIYSSNFQSFLRYVLCYEVEIMKITNFLNCKRRAFE